MSYHPTITLTTLEKRKQYWYFIFEHGLHADKFVQMLRIFQNARFYDCHKGFAGQGWLIKEEGLYFLAPHFTNYGEMEKQAKSTQKKCGHCSKIGQEYCCNPTVCKECLASHVISCAYATYTYSAHFADKQGNTLYPCEVCMKLTKERWKCVCHDKSLCEACYVQHRMTASKKCSTCSHYEAWKNCTCHNMPLCANCYHEHMKEEAKRKEPPKSQYTWDAGKADPFFEGIKFEYSNEGTYTKQQQDAFTAEQLHRMFEAVA